MTKPDQKSLLGGLSSAAIHMLLLIVLALIYAKVNPQEAFELQVAVANTDSAEFEVLEVEIEPSLQEPLDHVETQPLSSTELSHTEPDLVFDFGQQAVVEEVIDPSATLSHALAPRDDQTADQKNNKAGSFFGADAYGDQFVYVVDMSTSMGRRSEYGETRFRVACRELLRSIQALQPNQDFCVVMFCYRTRVMFDLPPRMIAATRTNKQRVASWINSLGLGRGTDPRYSVMIGLQLEPDAIFLLSDGEFNGQSVNAHGLRGNPTIERIISTIRNDAVPIHTIAFEDLRNRRRLRRIAASTGGTHRFVGHVSDQQLLLSDLSSRNVDDVLFGMNALIDGTRKVRDERHRRSAFRIITKKLTSSNAEIRRLAHDALVELADGHDLGPSGDDSILAMSDYSAAQDRWTRYWQDQLRDQRRQNQNVVYVR